MDPITNTQSAEVSAVVQDTVDAALLGKKIAADVKAGGAQAALAELPEAIALVEKGFGDVKAALPAIKAGAKTTEFWLVVAFGLGNGLYVGFTGHALPFDVNASLALVISVYTAARAIIKK